MPGKTAAMNPTPDHGEASYKGSGRLNGKKAVITGGDSGIGRAVAIAYAREGADVLISYLDEHEDARETERLVKEAGRKAVLLPGDIQDPGQCRAVIAKAVSELGGIDILVNNAAHQASFKSIDEISDEEWELTFKVNIHAMFYLTKAAVAHMKPGSCIINTASINSDVPNPTLLAYATTKGAIHNFTAGLAQMLAEKGIRANAVAPGPIWTPLIPSTLPDDSVKNFGKQVPMKRPVSRSNWRRHTLCSQIRFRAMFPARPSPLPAASRSCRRASRSRESSSSCAPCGALARASERNHREPKWRHGTKVPSGVRNQPDRFQILVKTNSGTSSALARCLISTTEKPDAQDCYRDRHDPDVQHALLREPARAADRHHEQAGHVQRNHG